MNKSTEFPGIFFTYSPKIFKAFRSNLPTKNIIIYIPGLGGSLLGDNIALELYTLCEKNYLTYVQPIFRSHPFYGLFTLEDDHEELSLLIQYFYDCNVLLVGHSTGCQNIMYLAREYHSYTAILIGPVSDREYMSSLNLIVPVNEVPKIFIMDDMPIKRERYLDLYHLNGKDDFFSSDLNVRHFQRLNPNKWDLIFIICEKDEYMKKSNIHLLKLIPNSKIRVLEGSGHFLDRSEDQFALGEIVIDIAFCLFVKK